MNAFIMLDDESKYGFNRVCIMFINNRVWIIRYKDISVML